MASSVPNEANFHLLRRNTRFISRRNRKTPAPQVTETGVGGSAAGFAPVANKRQVVAFHFLYQGLIAELTCIQRRDGWPKMVRPTAKPLIIGCAAASAKPARSLSEGASSRIRIPRLHGSSRSISAVICCQLALESGGSFHQSGDPQLIEVFQHSVVMALVFVRAIFRQDHLQQQFMA